MLEPAFGVNHLLRPVVRRPADLHAPDARSIRWGVTGRVRCEIKGIGSSLMSIGLRLVASGSYHRSVWCIQGRWIESSCMILWGPYISTELVSFLLRISSVHRCAPSCPCRQHHRHPCPNSHRRITIAATRSTATALPPRHHCPARPCP